MVFHLTDWQGSEGNDKGHFRNILRRLLTRYINVGWSKRERRILLRFPDGSNNKEHKMIPWNRPMMGTYSMKSDKLKSLMRLTLPSGCSVLLNHTNTFLHHLSIKRGNIFSRHCLCDLVKRTAKTNASFPICVLSKLREASYGYHCDSTGFSNWKGWSYQRTAKEYCASVPSSVLFNRKDKQMYYVVFSTSQIVRDLKDKPDGSILDAVLIRDTNVTGQARKRIQLRFPDVLNNMGKAVGIFHWNLKGSIGILLGESARLILDDFAIWFIWALGCSVFQPHHEFRDIWASKTREKRHKYRLRRLLKIKNKKESRVGELRFPPKERTAILTNI